VLDGRPTTPQEVTVSASSEFCGKEDVALVLISQAKFKPRIPCLWMYRVLKGFAPLLGTLKPTNQPKV
jgi:hypothetical protein